jgi:hypothetical protein
VLLFGLARRFWILELDSCKFGFCLSCGLHVAELFLVFSLHVGRSFWPIPIVMHVSHWSISFSCIRNFRAPSLIVGMILSECQFPHGDPMLVGKNFVSSGCRNSKNLFDVHNPGSLSDRKNFGIPNGLMIVFMIASISVAIF